MKSASHTVGFRRQQGAALIIGLILLVVLTLLAVSGMNTASTELRMAGNEQFRKAAFETAEAGVEQALATTDFNPDVPPPPVVAAVADAAAPNDVYSLAVVSTGCTNPPPMPGLESSAVKFKAFHFAITSQGESRRDGTTYQNAVATHRQGLYIVSPVPSC